MRRKDEKMVVAMRERKLDLTRLGETRIKKKLMNRYTKILD